MRGKFTKKILIFRILTPKNFVLSFKKTNFAAATLQYHVLHNSQIHIMRISHIVLSIALAACTAVPAAAQTQVLPYQPGVTLGGATYYLPKTSLRFVVTATCTTRHAGPFAQYAERFLGIKDAVKEDTDSWTLQGITAVPYSTPDEHRAYTVTFNPRSSAPLVTLSPDGILLAINDEAQYAPELPLGSVSVIPVENPDASDFFSEDYLRAGSNAKKAETVAEEIYDIREKRSLIANGEADFNPTDGQQLQLMLERQDAREQALKTLFVGTISKRQFTYVIDYTPKHPVDGELLFRFSEHLGLVEADDLAGEPFYIDVTDETTHVQVDDTLVIKPVKENKKNPFSEVHYRIPGRAKITVTDGKNIHFNQSYAIAQFGEVESLKGALFDDKYTTKVTFHPITGNLMRIDMAAPINEKKGGLMIKK